MRKLVGMLSLKEIRILRGINPTINRIGCDFLYDRGNKGVISNGVDMISFLERMNKRLEMKCCFSAFKLQVCGIPLEKIQRFCTDMKPHVRKLSIDLDKIPYWWYFLMSKGLFFKTCDPQFLLPTYSFS